MSLYIYVSDADRDLQTGRIRRCYDYYPVAEMFWGDRRETSRTFWLPVDDRHTRTGYEQDEIRKEAETFFAQMTKK